MPWSAALLATTALAAGGGPPAPDAPPSRDPLALRYAPVLHFARGDDEPAAVYARVVGGRWVQYWIYLPDNAQDRGIVRTGRHEGDWELAQVDTRTRTVAVSQHSTAERCPLGAGSLDLYLARGSHALYLRPGARDRPFPDPNDEHPGDGRVERPRVRAFAGAWTRDPRRWGDSRAAWWNPSEASSPRGPRFQPERFDPERFAADARPCRAADCARVDECDGVEKALGAGGLAAVVVVVAAAALRRRRRGGDSAV